MCLLWFTIRFTVLLMWDELHFPWSAQIRPGPHITSHPVVPACADLCIQSSLTIGDKGKYVDPAQEAMGSLTFRATSLWSCWQPWLSQQVTTQSSLFSWQGGPCLVHYYTDFETHWSLCFPLKGIIYPISLGLTEKNTLASKRQLEIQCARKQ